MTEENKQLEPVLALERLYLKDASFETTGHNAFVKQWQPEVDIKLTSSSEQVAEQHYEVALKVVVEVKLEGEIAYIADVTQAGIFLIDNVDDNRMAYVLAAYIPNIIFPFLREAVADLVAKGSFPQMLLTPVDFDAEFHANMERALANFNEEQAQVPTA